MDSAIAFAIGVMVGALFGVFLMAICCAAHDRGDDL